MGIYPRGSTGPRCRSSSAPSPATEVRKGLLRHYRGRSMSSSQRHGAKLFVRDGLCADAGAQQANHQVRFHGAAVEPVVEFGNIVLEVFLLDFVMGAEQKPLQIR